MVTVFTRATCAPCKSLKKILDMRGISYQIRDADTPEGREEAIRVSGAMTVPVTIVDEEVFVGLSPRLFSALK